MARLGRRQPLNVRIVRNPPVDPHVYFEGVASASASASGNLALESNFAGVSSAASGASGVLGVIFDIAGIGAASSGASGTLSIVLVVLPLVPTPAAETEFERAVRAIADSGTRITRRVDIYEADGETMWLSNAAFKAGNVSVDESRAERRTLELTLSTDQGGLYISPEDDGLWYDKIIKPYRGVILSDDTTVEWQLGEFMIDRLAQPRFPMEMSITGRDYTKKCMKSKFEFATSFGSGMVETTIKDIALNAGITKFIFPAPSKPIQRDFLFEKGTERWKAMNDLAQAYGYELFFDRNGYLVLREIVDSTTATEAWRFKSGPGGNLSDWDKSTSDDRLYNHIFVSGKGPDDELVWGEATNTEPSSPTRISRIGDRLFQFHSDFINTNEQAQETADKFLLVHALQTWELGIMSLVYPFLEGGEIAVFENPDPAPGETAETRWRTANFQIPMMLELMPLQGKRVQVVG